MTVSISPTYPVAGELTTLSATGTIGTSFEYEVLSVPSDSDIALGVLTVRGSTVDYFTPDVDGVFGIRAFEYVDFSGAAGGVGGQARRKLIDTQDASVYVGTELVLDVRTKRGDGASIVLNVANDTVREVTIEDTTTERARLAAIQTSVTTALSDMEDEPASSLGENLVTRVKDLRAKYEAHRVLTASSVHAGSGDSTHFIEAQPSESIEGAIALLNELSEQIALHMTVRPTPSGFWHTVSDTKNVGIVEKASTLSQAIVLEADVSERMYERHRAQTASPASHGNSPTGDGTNPLATAPTKLSLAIVAYLDAIAAQYPTAPTGENQGNVTASHAYGLRKR